APPSVSLRPGLHATRGIPSHSPSLCRPALTGHNGYPPQSVTQISLQAPPIRPATTLTACHSYRVSGSSAARSPTRRPSPPERLNAAVADTIAELLRHRPAPSPPHLPPRDQTRPPQLLPRQTPHRPQHPPPRTTHTPPGLPKHPHLNGIGS